ncbi:MAG: glycosyltransferase family 9 protein [Candidatus Omnitrophica bacterium]|nr:glycosyltransferase family 9 protein [Candidatus Omnitrophota bacterium]
MPLLKCRNVLIVRTDRLGDVVLTTPVFKALRKAYPAAGISVLLTPATADLVRGNPYINEVIIDDRHGANKGAFGALRLAREIRRRHFDAAFIFHTKRRYNLACFLAGVPWRVGFKNNKFGVLLTRPVKDTRSLGGKHEAEYCLEVLKSVGIEDAGLDVLVPVQKEAEAWAMLWFNGHGIHSGELIAIHPGASDSTKSWPTVNFARLIDVLTGRYAFKIALIGGQETRDTAKEIARLCRSSVLDLTGATTVGQTAAILRRCRLLISNDSGPLHIGAGVGSYVIGLFLRNQPGINPARWRPLGPKAFMLANKGGEEIILDPKGRIKSGKLDSITVEEVVDLTEHIFTRDNQSMFYW